MNNSIKNLARITLLYFVLNCYISSYATPLTPRENITTSDSSESLSNHSSDSSTTSESSSTKSSESSSTKSSEKDTSESSSTKSSEKDTSESSSTKSSEKDISKSSSTKSSEKDISESSKSNNKPTNQDKSKSSKISTKSSEKDISESSKSNNKPTNQDKSKFSNENIKLSKQNISNPSEKDINPNAIKASSSYASYNNFLTDSDPGPSLLAPTNMDGRLLNNENNQTSKESKSKFTLERCKKKIALSPNSAGNAIHGSLMNLKSRSPFFYVEPETLIPSDILDNSSRIIHNRISKRHIKFFLNAPTSIEKTPGQFSIDITIENLTSKNLKDLSVRIAFHDDEGMSLIGPVPEVENIALINTRKFSFNVSVGNIDGGNKRSSFCVYVCAKMQEDKDLTNKDLQGYYLITSCTQQILLTESPPRKAIIIVPGICGSELFSSSAQVIDGRQYSQGYRIWPPEGAMHVVEGGFMCGICNTLKTDSARLMRDFSLIACNEDGTSKAEIMVCNPIYDCRTNPDRRNFGSVNCYQDLIESLSQNKSLDNYQIVFFSYDWRMSNTTTGKALEKFIEKEKYSSVVLIAHSMGGLLSSSYIASCENISKLESLILLGTPLHGAAKAFSAIEKGTFFDGLVGVVSSPVAKPFIKDLARKCQSIYEMLPPKQSFLKENDGYIYEKNGNCSFSKQDRYSLDDYNKSLKLIRSRNWTNSTKDFLKNAKAFHDSLYNENGEFVLSNQNLNIYNLVGFNTDTSKGFYVDIKSKNKCKLTTIYCDGDGTVSLEGSTANYSLSIDKTYFIKDTSHMGLMSENHCLDLINNIICNKVQTFNPTKIQKYTPNEEDRESGCFLPILSCIA